MDFVANNQDRKNEAQKRKNRLFDRYLYRSVKNQTLRGGLPSHQIFVRIEKVDAVLRTWLGPHYKRRIEYAIRRSATAKIKLSTIEAGLALILTIQTMIPQEGSRREISINDPSLDGLDPVDPADGPDRNLEAEEERDRLARLVQHSLNQMSGSERMVFEMCYYRGMTSEEVAVDLGMTVKAVNRARDRARSKLKESLESNRRRLGESPRFGTRQGGDA